MSPPLDSIWPWLQPPMERLIAEAGAGRLSHGLLVTGEPATGKSSFALAFCARMLCSGQGAGGCGCRACAQTRAGTHPDLRVCAPLEDSPSIKVDQIRALCEWLVMTAQYGGRKLALIDPADAMNEAAANALLKSLEEPVADTFLVLVSARPARLPATIRSRCRKLLLPSPTVAEGQAVLARQLDGTQDPAHLLRAARGHPGQALRRAAHSAGQAELVDVLRGLSRGQLLPHQGAQRLAALEEGVEWVLDGLYRLTGATIRAASTADPGQLSGEDPAATLSEVAQRAAGELGGWYSLLDELVVQRRVQGSGSNPNPALLLERVLTAWTRLAGH